MSAPWNYDLYIDGEWTEGEGGGQIDVIDPATEEVIGSVAGGVAPRTRCARSRPPARRSTRARGRG